MEDHGEPRDYWKLHFIVFLWGFTGVLGELIDLPSIELVFYRCLLASITLGVILRKKLRVPARRAIAMFATGGVIGLHWVLFFLAVKVANVSVCMVGAATISLWTALLEPLMVRGRVLKRMDLVFGVLVIGAVAIIFQSETQYAVGFAIAIAAAIAAAVFSIINGFFAKHTPHRVITWYELTGACLFCALCLPISAHWLSEGRGLDLMPSAMDWFWIVILAELCTVYAYSEYVSLLKRLSVFTINFANNLEPVYGIILGGIILGDYQHLGAGFYIGTALIALLVLTHTGMSRRKRLTIG
ncbi:DMT family transporter [Allorhodopirellula solitaria]|uniref:EamA-like transporter family protein n=1 Tax=Allorhodopirellula solitaria TaxID=2527987 RepID=A0A5C5YFH5_9BACT|nr:DMT family transporter [Allorhodopirellula solitaria]TWT73095.1 EamA-like transporter family protein [Allorhodopirellula solitaria]